MSMAALASKSRWLGLLHRCSYIPLRKYADTVNDRLIELHRFSRLNRNTKQEPLQPFTPTDEEMTKIKEYRTMYPEFLPHMVVHHRDNLFEQLERRDMLRRRSVLEVPEFFVGSVLAVTSADPYSESGSNRFLGICIDRRRTGLRHQFILRNSINNQGVEIMYELYNPSIQSIEMIKLERRLDKELYYLRDAPLKYSHFPQDMDPVPHPKGAEAPLNTMKIKLGPRPWHTRWERLPMKGLEDLGLPERFYKRAAEVGKPWEEFDLMKKYRTSQGKEDEVDKVMTDVYRQLKEKDEPPQI